MPNRLRALPALLLLLAAATACASSGATSGTQRRGSREVITEEEIAAVEVSTALDLIQRLRPEFLRPRGGGTAGQVAIYLDGVRQQNSSVLQTISKEMVREVRYINAADATTRFGTGHAAGAILVATRR
jgi:hypothetical protein